MHLIDYINSYKNWEERLTQPPYNLEVKTEGEYKLLKYKMIESDFDYTEVQEARGCIVAQDFDGEWIYVCRPFKKFFNYGERWAAHIEWSYTFITEKIDGSLMKMWFHNGRWHLSTNGTIDAFKAPINESKYTFGQIFEYILEIDISSFAEECDLNPNFTYLFEMVSPETRVVIPYDYKIYYLTRFENSNGAEVLLLAQKKLKLGQFVEFPQTYNFNSLEEVIAEAEKLDSLHEGFVVTDAYSNRVKVKSPEYLRAARLFAKGHIGKIDVLEMLLNNSVDDFLGYFPEYLQMVLGVQYDVMELCNKLVACWDLYGDLPSRKEFALKVKNLAGAPLLFMKYTNPKLNFYTYVWDMDYKKLARILGYKEEK